MVAERPGVRVITLAACKWRVAAPEATFRMPGLAFGLALGTRRFAAIVGRERARALLESLATFDAETALEMGFATAVCAPEMWDVVLDTAVATVAKLGPGREALYRALAPTTDAEDMRDLVSSASVPGLKERIAKYLAR